MYKSIASETTANRPHAAQTSSTHENESQSASIFHLAAALLERHSPRLNSHRRRGVHTVTQRLRVRRLIRLRLRWWEEWNTLLRCRSHPVEPRLDPLKSASPVQKKVAGSKLSQTSPRKQDGALLSRFRSSLITSTANSCHVCTGAWYDAPSIVTLCARHGPLKRGTEKHQNLTPSPSTTLTF